MYLWISKQQWAYKAIVETLKLITNIIIASFANDVLNAGHQMIHKLQEIQKIIK